MSKVRAPQIVGLIFIGLGIVGFALENAMELGEEGIAVDMQAFLEMQFAALATIILCVGSILLGAIMVVGCGYRRDPP